MKNLETLLFSLINYARFVNVNPEDALEKTNKKVHSPFPVHGKTNKSQRTRAMSDLSLEEMDIYWNEAKSYLGAFLSKNTLLS